MNIRITAMGELLTDFVSTGKTDGRVDFSAYPGGAPCNFLAAATRCGAKTAFIGKVGNDAFGDMLINTLKSRNINVSGVVRDDRVFTTLAFVTLDENGEREFSFARKPGADTALNSAETDYSLIDNCDVFHVGTLSLTDEPAKTATYTALDYAEKHGKLISFDPNYRAALWKGENETKEAILSVLPYADIVKISREEAELALGVSYIQAAELIVSRYGVNTVAVTLGRNGCYYTTGECCGFTENYDKVKTVDTTGAGDIFGGFFIPPVAAELKDKGSISEEKLSSICRIACTVASLSTAKYGGMSSIPSDEDIARALVSEDERG